MPNEGYTYRERLGAVPPGTTLLGYLSERYPHSSTEAWRGRIEAGLVTVDGAPAGPDTALTPGREVAWLRPPWVEPAAPCAYALLYRDREILAVAKPAGLPTLPGGGYLEHTLLAVVRRRHPEASPLHRLGRWTSGIMLFARTPEALAVLSEAWRQGRVRKRYRALASGRAERKRFTVELPIGPVPHAVLGTVHGVTPAGRRAVSAVRVLEQRADAFLADVEIETGRPHQIRIHLAGAGHPLVGDPLYPEGGIPAWGSTALPGDPGYLLHAAELRFPHPQTGRALRLRSEPPPALRLSDRRPG